MNRLRSSYQRAITTLIVISVLLYTLIIPMEFLSPAYAGKYGDITPTTEELALFEKINENRTQSGVNPLELNATLCWVARAHSQDMIDYDFFDHPSSVQGQFNGATFQERVRDYAEYENSYIGECIAYKPWGIDVESTMSSWKNSPTHWEIIVDPNFREIGIGLLEGEWDGFPGAGLHTVDFGGHPLSVDLTVSEGDIQFNPSEPYEGEDVTLSVTIHNDGSTDSYPVTSRFFDGDPDSGGTQIGSEQRISHILTHGESTIASVIWGTTGKAGYHDIYVVVDYEDIISETNEGNNKAYKTIFVNGSSPPTNPPIHLKFGWNLVSFPYTVSDSNLDQLLGSISGKYDAVQNYNSSDRSDRWKHHSTQKPSSINDLQDLDNKMGFYIHVTDYDGAELVIDGQAPSSPQSISLRKGWNLVGYPSETARLRDDALNNLDFGIEIDAILSQDNVTKAYMNIGELDEMEPGKGYWVHATSNCQWIYLV
jgi:uncharacterized protein YkwD